VDDISASDDLSQNVLAISALTTTYRDAGVEPIYFNILLVAIAGLLLTSICAFHNASPLVPLSVLFLCPSTIYYSQTSTKEILTLFASCLFIFSLARTRGILRLSLGCLSVAMTYAFRVQTAIPMLAVLAISHTSSVFQRRYWLLLFVVLALTLPVLYAVGLVDSEIADYFRVQLVSTTGLAKYVDFGLRRIPLAGLVLLPIRMVQNATEPFPGLNFLQINPGVTSVSVYGLFGFATVVVTWFFTCEFVRVLWRLLVHGEGGPAQVDSITLYAGLFWLMISTNSFVHGRYLYNVLPAFALVATLNRTFCARNVQQHSMTTLEDLPSWSSAPSFAAWCTLIAASGAIILLRP
jgi:hypothetical protein